MPSVENDDIPLLVIITLTNNNSLMLKRISVYWYTLKAALVLVHVLNVYRAYRMLLEKSLIIIRSIYAPSLRSNHREIHTRKEEPTKDKKKNQQSKKIKKKKAKLTKKASTYNSLKKYFLAYIYLVGYLKDGIRCRCITAIILQYGNVGSTLFTLVAVAWICEKLNINLRPVRKGSAYYDIFNATLNYSESCQCEEFAKIREPITQIEHMRHLRINLRDVLGEFSRDGISSEYGHKIISTLSIKQELQQQADQWYQTNMKRNFIAIHYRGTDALLQRKMTIDAYITYLEKVLDKDSHIFACSEKEQFITRMKTTFPGRVIARNIKRSHTDEPIHGGCDSQQIRDAFIDLFILSKAELIYTVGSTFIDAVRFLNPAIKIICLQPRAKRIPNYLPVPEKDLVEKMKQEYLDSEISVQ